MAGSVHEKEELLSKSELSIWLDFYDDIFSDFDSRPLSERALSDDFLNEARKMVKEKPSGRIELKLLMPTQQRNTETETIVIKSLHTHFKHFKNSIESEMKEIRRRGYLLTAIGVTIMILTGVLINVAKMNLIFNSLRVIMEPAGWFLAWTGLDHIIFISKRKKAELEFNEKMSHAEIRFLSF
jgi:hypothetical protein